MNGLRVLISALLMSLVAFALHAQSDTVVSLLTAFPGKDIYELEGHSAIRIKIGEDRDYAVNYGLYDFNAPNFVYRFVKGETDYMVGITPMQWFVNGYALSGRRVEEIPLNLSSVEKKRLIGLLEENLLPQNRVYRYNYVKDNCATRPLRIIEMSLSDSLILGHTEWDDLENPASFRDVMRYYHRNYPWYQFGIDLALGSGIDYPLSSREYSFVPMLMAEQMTGAMSGNRRLALDKVVLCDYAPDAAVDSPTPWYFSPLCVCWSVFLLLLIATIYDLRRRRSTRWIDSAYFGILGLAGLLLTFLIFVSVHEATSPNWLYLWINPLCLIPTIFIWLKKCNKVVFCYQIVNFAVVLTMLIAWPCIPQSANAAFLPLVLGDLLRSASYVYLNISHIGGTKK